MYILISNLLSELIFDFGKWSNWKYANRRRWYFLQKKPLSEVWLNRTDYLSKEFLLHF